MSIIEQKHNRTVSKSKSFTSKVMMVRPACFGFNEETALDNAFQSKISGMSSSEISAKAIIEFDELVSKLKKKNITVEVIQDSKDLENPDAVFPNNWISFHDPDFIVTYPMLANKRRTERRNSTIETIEKKYTINTRYDYEKHESEDKFLEGTGSMIFDRENKIAYACRSIRTNESLFDKFCKEFQFNSILFNAADDNGMPIYHTNVMLCIGNSFVVICMESIIDETERLELKKSFKSTGKEIIEVSLQQMNQYAGNMIQLRNNEGDYFLIMSTTAYNSLTDKQVNRLESKTTIIHSDLKTIETFGGGSARCMIAEIFLNTKK